MCLPCTNGNCHSFGADQSDDGIYCPSDQTNCLVTCSGTDACKDSPIFAGSSNLLLKCDGSTACKNAKVHCDKHVDCIVELAGTSDIDEFEIHCSSSGTTNGAQKNLCAVYGNQASAWFLICDGDATKAGPMENGIQSFTCQGDRRSDVSSLARDLWCDSSVTSCTMCYKPTDKCQSQGQSPPCQPGEGKCETSTGNHNQANCAGMHDSKLHIWCGQSNSCVCTNGAAVSGANCPSPGTSSCLHCDKGHYKDGMSCTSCALGKFQHLNEFTGDGCTPYSYCAKGEKQDVPPTARRDRGCTKCSMGRYQDSDTFIGSTCTPHQTCQAWERETGTPPDNKNDRTCSNNICQCSHGDPVSLNTCTTHQAESCGSCDPNYRLSTQQSGQQQQTCIANESGQQQQTCSCPKGTAATSGCSSPGHIKCTQCNLGYTLESGTNTCTLNICQCNDGTPQPLCLQDKRLNCTSCFHGYHLDNNQCNKNVCKCDGGIPAMDCSIHGATNCTASNENQAGGDDDGAAQTEGTTSLQLARKDGKDINTGFLLIEGDSSTNVNVQATASYLPSSGRSTLTCWATLRGGTTTGNDERANDIRMNGIPIGGTGGGVLKEVVDGDAVGVVSSQAQHVWNLDLGAAHDLYNDDPEQRDMIVTCLIATNGLQVSKEASLTLNVINVIRVVPSSFVLFGKDTNFINAQGRLEIITSGSTANHQLKLVVQAHPDIQGEVFVKSSTFGTSALHDPIPLPTTTHASKRTIVVDLPTFEGACGATVDICYLGIQIANENGQSNFTCPNENNVYCYNGPANDDAIVPAFGLDGVGSYTLRYVSECVNGDYTAAGSKECSVFETSQTCAFGLKDNCKPCPFG